MFEAGVFSFNNSNVFDPLFVKSLVIAVWVNKSRKSVSEYLELLKTQKFTGNIANFIGHGNVRATIMENLARDPTESELNEMRMLVEDGMQAGAFGMTTGLLYLPGVFS